MKYYWEGQALYACGSFEAEDDAEALLQRRRDWIFIYRERQDHGPTTPEYITIYHDDRPII